MAFPPRFGMHQFQANTFMQYGAVPMVPMVPATHYIVPTLQGGVITSTGPRNMRPRREPAYEKPPVTTVFVGNIHEKASNDLIKCLLQKCGNIVQWKRIQGPNGKFQAFGFCEFDHPDSTLRAVRLLNDFIIGEKKLVVKCDEKTRELLKEFFNKRRQQQGKPPIEGEGDNLPCDESMKREDPSYLKSLQQAVQEMCPDLASSLNHVPSARIKSPTLSGKGGNLDIESLDREKKEYIAREINLFRQAHKDDKDTKKESGGRHRHDRSLSPQNRSRETSIGDVERSRASRNREKTPPDSPRSSHSRNSGFALQQLSVAKAGSTTRRRSRSREESPIRIRRTSRSRSRHADSEDDEEAYERKRLERKIRDKEHSYQERLQKWENREHKRGKDYEKEKAKQKEKRRDELREAKKLKEFFEDYDDERDDVKFYKGKSYENRRRDYEREIAVDAKDKIKEKEELEEIKRKLMEEGIPNPDEEINKMQKEQEEKLLKRLRADSSESPSPVHPQKVDISSSEVSSPPHSRSVVSDDDSEVKSKQDSEPWRSVGSDVPVPKVDIGSKVLGFAGLKLGSAGSSQSQLINKPAFVPTMTNEDDEDPQGGTSTSRKRLVPLEYSEEENQVLLVDAQAQQMASMTAEEKRKAIKSLIEKIPTSKEELFGYNISWGLVDATLIEKRLKPWVTKKIVEYIGEEEASLVEFICQKVAQKSTPQSILEDISMVLDEEASVFVVKLWRLLIYEIEAKRYGLVKLDSQS